MRVEAHHLLVSSVAGYVSILFCVLVVQYFRAEETFRVSRDALSNGPERVLAWVSFVFPEVEETRVVISVPEDRPHAL